MATGVYFQKGRNRWRARVRSHGREFFVYRETEQEAIEAYEALRANIAKKERVVEKKILTNEEREEKRKRKRANERKYRLIKKSLKEPKIKHVRSTEERREGARRSYQKHRYKALARAKGRELRKKGAEPAWGKAQTQKTYSNLRKEANQCAVEHHVDHIIPINGKIKGAMDLQLVCGLHVWYNLRLITAEENLKKGCYTWPNKPNYTEEDINELRKLAKENC